MFFQFTIVKTSSIHLWSIFWIHEFHHVWNPWWNMSKERKKPGLYKFTGLQKTEKYLFEFNWIVINKLSQQFRHMGYYQQTILLQYFYQEIFQDKMAILRRPSFFSNSCFLPPRKFGLTYQIDSFSLDIMNIQWKHSNVTNTLLHNL